MIPIGIFCLEGLTELLTLLGHILSEIFLIKGIKARKYRKFITAKTSDQRIGRKDGLNLLCCFRQNTVSIRMTEIIIDFLKIVQINHKEHQILTAHTMLQLCRNSALHGLFV